MIFWHEWIFQAECFWNGAGLGGMAGEFCPVPGQNSIRQSMRNRQGCPQTSEPQEDGAKSYWVT